MNQKPNVLVAWHYTENWITRQGYISDLKSIQEVITLTNSHIHLPVGLATYQQDPYALLEEGFNFFNWMLKDMDGIAPDEVNQVCRKHKSHASMSVGDVLQVGKQFYFCCTAGWDLIPHKKLFAPLNNAGILQIQDKLVTL